MMSGDSSAMPVLPLAEREGRALRAVAAFIEATAGALPTYSGARKGLACWADQLEERARQLLEEET